MVIGAMVIGPGVFTGPSGPGSGNGGTGITIEAAA
jgi:hypothetical protein